MAEEHSRNPATSRPGEKLNECNCTKSLMNVVNYTDVHSESANEVQSMCQPSHSARNQGARESTKRHETTTVV